MEPLLRDVRMYVYSQMIETSAAPTAAETANALSRSTEEIEAAYRALADARMLVLQPHSHVVWMAMPFSNIQTCSPLLPGAARTTRTARGTPSGFPR